MENENQLITRESSDLEVSLEGTFKGVELLIAKSVFLRKCLSRSSASLSEPINYLQDLENDGDMTKYLLTIYEGINKLGLEMEKIDREYAEKLGVSNNRFQEILEYIYMKILQLYDNSTKTFK